VVSGYRCGVSRVRLRGTRNTPRVSGHAGAVQFGSPRETPLPLSMNVLLMRWDTKPDKRIRGTFLRPGRHTERPSMPAVSMGQRNTS
jgi:hypothetical protein